LREWPCSPLEGLAFVRPPNAAIEWRAKTEGMPSLWVEATPRPKSAYLAGLMRCAVWVTSPDVVDLLAGMPK
jgi:hypothetical protein